MQIESKYPLEPPYDDQVTFYQEAVVRQGPQGRQKLVKICPICNYPINILVVAYPCQHYFCHDCYLKNPYACGYCGSLNSKVQKIPAKTPIFSQDQHYFKVFKDEQELAAHMRNIQDLKKQ